MKHSSRAEEAAEKRTCATNRCHSG